MDHLPFAETTKLELLPEN